MSDAPANTFLSEAGSIDTGTVEPERVTATVNSEEAVETGLFTATATAQTRVGSDAATPDSKTDASVPPKCIPPVFERMPPELKLLKNWVLWALVWNGSKWTKRPIQISGYGASTTKSKHWSSFGDVKQAYELAVQRGYMELREKGKPVQRVPIGGVGFVFDGHPDADGLVFAGVDFDKVISGVDIASLAEERIRRLGSYTERSVSGGGLHVIVKARPLASGIAHGGVEMYTSGRFFTMTGRAPENARIVAAPVAFTTLAGELQSGNQAQDGSARTSTNGQQDGFTAAKRERLRKLFGDPDSSLSDGLETNLEEIRSAVSAIPVSAISAEADWMRFARALAHSAAIHKNQSEEFWEILDTASRPAPGYNESDNRSRWLRYIGEAFARENPITIATVFDLAKKHGWQGWSPTEEAASASGASQANAQQKSSRRATSIASLPLIPPKRRWLHGNDLKRGAVSMLVAPGGRAKSTWLLTCALACASGRPLLGAHVYGGPLRVLYLSAEDSTDEIALRLRAAMQHHGLSDADVPGLNVIGAESWGLPLLSAARSAAIDQRGWGALNAELEGIKTFSCLILSST